MVIQQLVQKQILAKMASQQTQAQYRAAGVQAASQSSAASSDRQYWADLYQYSTLPVEERGNQDALIRALASQYPQIPAAQIRRDVMSMMSS